VKSQTWGHDGYSSAFSLFESTSNPSVIIYANCSGANRGHFSFVQWLPFDYGTLNGDEYRLESVLSCHDDITSFTFTVLKTFPSTVFHCMSQTARPHISIPNQCPKTALEHDRDRMSRRVPDASHCADFFPYRSLISGEEPEISGTTREWTEF
jgi:hypothetical protein